MYDAESGLHYNRNRYYDPQTGQYLSPDPISLAGGLRTQGYVHNPNEWVDPLGLCGCRQTLEQRAADLVKRNGGKNSVTIKHSNGQVRVDLAGKSHHSKELGDVPTPHIQNYKNNVIPRGPRQGQVGSITKDGDALPADANTLRMVDRYLRSQGQ